MSVSSCPSDYRATGWTSGIALRLGRVSNLPTVWTNTLAALVISGGSLAPAHIAIMLLAMSLAYIGGMYLNDAFDRNIDARERPERPIPAGHVPAREVFIAGFLMLAVSIMLVSISTFSYGGEPGTVLAASTSALLLAACIVLYNLWHKGNVLSPVIMGMCRLLVYITCAFSVSREPATLLYISGAMTFSYLIGLTYTAKQEKLQHLSTLWPLVFLSAPLLFGIYHVNTNPALWLVLALISVWILYCLMLIVRRQPGDMPKAVVSLIAGISLIDALLLGVALSLANTPMLMIASIICVCMAAFLLTMILQRYIAGT